jgi:hypothetical protein
MNSELQLRFIPKKDFNHFIDKVIDIYMIQYPKKIKDSCEIVSYELLENAIKYGDSIKEQPEIHFKIKLDKNSISISIKNGINSTDNLADFQKSMSDILQNKNRSVMYEKRLLEILENSNEKDSKLGLFKIIAETDFDLNYSLENKILTIEANLKVMN